MNRRSRHRSKRIAAWCAVCVIVGALGVACLGLGSGRHYIEVRNLGSDTMLEVGFAWAEAYDKVNDHVVVSLSGGGSGTGIAELIAGQIHLANSSRKLKDAERKRADDDEESRPA